MRWLTSFLAGALLATASLAAQGVTPDSTARPITLQEALDLSLKVQPGMVTAIGNQRNAAASSRSAIGSFLPSLSTNWSAIRGNNSRIDPTTGRPVPAGYSYTFGLTASLDLFTGLRRAFNLKATSATKDAADAGLISQRFQTMLQTAQAFYAVLADQELVRVAQAQVLQAQQQLDISSQKLRAGSATRSDSLTSVVTLGNARLTLLQAESNFATAEAAFGRQIGIDTPVRAVADTGLPTLPDTSNLRVEALGAAPIVTQADATARSARAQIWTARSQYFPMINVSYNDARQGITSPSVSTVFNDYSETFSWRFGLSWTLFNGLVREQQQVSASVARDEAEAQAADARRQVNEQFTQYASALNTAWAQIDIAKSNVTASEEALRVQTERYKVGAGILLDVLTAQSNLTQAQVSLVQAQFNYLIARAQLIALVGHKL
ncbi:MAG TPA: TolC family protein [Gemmatimonadales bacterium]|nr:TolC family protein [Gemmatimonadales bacterium]